MRAQTQMLGTPATRARLGTTWLPGQPLTPIRILGCSGEVGGQNKGVVSQPCHYLALGLRRGQFAQSWYKFAPQVGGTKAENGGPWYKFGSTEAGSLSNCASPRGLGLEEQRRESPSQTRTPKGARWAPGRRRVSPPRASPVRSHRQGPPRPATSLVGARLRSSRRIPPPFSSHAARPRLLPSPPPPPGPSSFRPSLPSPRPRERDVWAAPGAARRQQPPPPARCARPSQS